MHTYVPTLVRILGRPNKVYIRRAEKCLQVIIHNCHVPSILIHLRNGLDERSEHCKRASASALGECVENWEVSRWSGKDLELLELCVRKMATDKDAQVRKTGKAVWANFAEIWPERVDE